MPGEAVEKGTQQIPVAETQHFFHKQRATISKLRDGNAKLKEELLLENKFSVQPTSANYSALIANLQDQSDVYTRKIELERQRQAELEEKVGTLREKIVTQRKQMGGINAAHEDTIQMQKQMRILENRLEKAYHRYNESRSHNQRLREGIDNLRRERLVFDDIFKKLEKALQVQKREMAAIIHTSNQANEAREKALAEMAALKAASDREQAAAEAEWKQLTQLIEHDRKERELARAAEIEERERKTAALMREEVRGRKRAVKGTWAVARDKSAQNASVEKVQHYTAAFEQILKATGTQDIDSLVEQFLAAEDANFTLFSYVAELNGEIEKLEEQIGDIRSEIQKYRGADASQQTQRHRTLQELEERLEEARATAALYERRHGGAVARVAELKAELWGLWEAMGCNTPAMRELLGEGGVTEGNLMQYLGILEQRANEMLQEYVAGVAPNEDAAADKVASLLGTSRSALGLQFVIDPPSTLAPDDDSASEDGEDERPLDRQALEAKVHRSLSRRGDLIKAKPASKPPSPKKQ